MALRMLSALALLVLIGCGSTGGDDDRRSGETGGVGPTGGAASGSAGSGSTGSNNPGGATAASGGQEALGGAGAAPGGLPPHQIAVMRTSACALDATGAVTCWGRDADTQLVPDGTFAEIHAGPGLACAVRADGTVACFNEESSEGAVVDYAPTVAVSSLDLDVGLICGIETGSRVVCDSPIGFGDLLDPPGDALDQIAVGDTYLCGIRAGDGTLLCWGSSGNDQCPDAGQLDAPAGQFVALATRNLHSCALDSAGEVHCWGAGEPSDDPAQTCYGTLVNHGQSTPPGGRFRQVSAGDFTTCAVAEDGSLACWGAGTEDVCDAYDCRQGRPPTGTFEQVAIGLGHGCAMRADRTVACWGYEGADGGDGRLEPPPPFR